jgi:hypothetical protein
VSAIEIRNGTIQIDASILGKGLGLEPARLPELLRSGAITSRCERGVDEDEGRYRLSFFHAGRRLRLVTDASGHVLRCSSIDYGNQPLPATLRKPG